MANLEKDINSVFSNSISKAVVNVLYTANWLSNKQIKFFKPFGISPQQYNILRILRDANTPLKMQIIKKRMLEQTPNATRLIDKLCAKKLTKRNSCKTDRRIVFIEITNKGLTLLKEIDQKLEQEIFCNLNTTEAEQLSYLLDKFRD